jgi:undecaprenyl-diphosphatase
MTGLDPLAALVLGLVEGLTEFIPVSSTGHLIVVGHWLGFVGARAAAFEITIQLGAVLAVVWHYRAMLRQWVSAFLRPATVSRAESRGAKRVFSNLAIAFLPAAIVGLLTHRYITTHLFSPVVVAWALVVGGVAMWAIEVWCRPAIIDRVTEMPRAVALGIGVAQVASLIPGMSRSASTIMGALLLGVTRPAAAEFSFLLAIPVMIAATALELGSAIREIGASDIPAFVVGFVMAFASALVVIRFLLRFLVHHDFRGFAAYRVVFGLLLIAALAHGLMPTGR